MPAKRKVLSTQVRSRTTNLLDCCFPINVTALARTPRHHLPNAVDVGPLQLSAMASAAPAQSKLKPPVQSAKQQAPKVQASKHQTSVAHAGLEDTDDSSWGDGSSTEEVCRSSLCLWHAFLYVLRNKLNISLFRISQLTLGPLPTMVMMRGKMWKMLLCPVSRTAFEARKSKHSDLAHMYTHTLLAGVSQATRARLQVCFASHSHELQQRAPRENERAQHLGYIKKRLLCGSFLPCEHGVYPLQLKPIVRHYTRRTMMQCACCSTMP